METPCLASLVFTASINLNELSLGVHGSFDVKHWCFAMWASLRQVCVSTERTATDSCKWPAHPHISVPQIHTSWTENLKYFRKNCLGVWLCGGVWNGGQSLLLNCKHRTCIHCTWKMSVPIILSCYMQTCLDLHNVVCLMLTRDFLCCWIYPHADQGCFLWGKRGSASLKNGMGK